MAACTSAVDYWAEPKPAYYAVARAYTPLTVTAAFPTIAWGGRELFEAEVWANDSRNVMTASLHLRLIGASGRVYAEQTQLVAFASNAATYLTNTQYPIPNLTDDIFFLDLRLTDPSGATLAANRYIFTRTANLAALMAPQPMTTLAVEILRHPGSKAGRGLRRGRGERGQNLEDVWTVTVTNTGAFTAFFVWLEDARARGGVGGAYFDDNYFCLFPGERRTMAVTWDGVPEDERRLDVGSWNTRCMTNAP
jgi:beta-mannosidase